MNLDLNEAEDGNSKIKNSKKHNIEKNDTPNKIAKIGSSSPEIHNEDAQGENQPLCESYPSNNEGETMNCEKDILDYSNNNHYDNNNNNEIEEDKNIVIANAHDYKYRGKKKKKKKFKEHKDVTNHENEKPKKIKEKHIDKEKKNKTVKKLQQNNTKNVVINPTEIKNPDESNIEGKNDKEEEDNDDKNEDNKDAIEKSDEEEEDDDDDDEEYDEEEEDDDEEDDDEEDDDEEDDEEEDDDEEYDEEEDDEEEEDDDGENEEEEDVKGGETKPEEGGEEEKVKDEEKEKEDDDVKDEEEGEDDEEEDKEHSDTKDEEDAKEKIKLNNKDNSSENDDDEKTSNNEKSVGDDEDDNEENEDEQSSVAKTQKRYKKLYILYTEIKTLYNESVCSEYGDRKKNDRLFASLNDVNSPNKLFSEYVGTLNIFGGKGLDLEKLQKNMNKKKKIIDEKKDIKMIEEEDPFENEEIIYSENTIKINKFVKKDGKQEWSGYLPVKIQIMKNKENDKHRILCFQKGSGRLFLNTDIFEGFRIIPSKNLSALFNGRDIGDEKIITQYIVTFISSSSRDDFISKINDIAKKK
ncbi:conserved Plasmodium protein, unknown function [Plasmodium vinckei petteri]|uniref:RanBD1 domain-containing protein n=1 Tax=Plasmodium vinckei petteri TaxID=138298 RepID=A0A6V7SSH2_PLAVN|nr:conserved Plasmodium protein, unknown function [Plasmodium vinckei petteri]